MIRILSCLVVVFVLGAACEAEAAQLAAVLGINAPANQANQPAAAQGQNNIFAWMNMAKAGGGGMAGPGGCQQACFCFAQSNPCFVPQPPKSPCGWRVIRVSSCRPPASACCCCCCCFGF